MHKTGRHSKLTQFLPSFLEKEQGKKMPSAYEEDMSSMAFLKKELEASLSRINILEKENQELKQELSRMKTQVNTLKAHDAERKTMLWKKLQTSMDSKIPERSQQKPQFVVGFSDSTLTPEKLNSNKDQQLSQSTEIRERFAAKSIPKTPTFHKDINVNRLQSTAPAGPAAAPPPPPPPPSKLIGGSKAVRRVPEVMEFYRSLMKRDALKESKHSGVGNQVIPINPKNMIGEIENRSSHLLAIKSDIETQRDFISYLSREVESAAFTEISEVESFVKWLDRELSCLVDERAVLKHFPNWPERKADALREAACSYRDLKNILSEVLSFNDNPKQPLTQSLRKMQALQDRLERIVNNVERVREGTSKRYKELHIPWAWMLDTGIIGQLKISSLTLAKQYMRRIAKELQCCSDPAQDDNYLLQGVRFACQVHQFAGGFDAEAEKDFEQLRRLGTSKTIAH